MIAITREAWKRFAPKCPPAYTTALFDNLHLLEEAGILENEHRWCHFAATVYHETGDFAEIREDLSYKTAKQLKKTWPSRFGSKTDDEIKPLLRNPKGLAEAVYGGRMGNRPGTTDAYDTRGGGWFNSTGYGIVCGYCEKIGVPYHPSVMDDPVITLRFAVLEWTETNCNQWADENDIRKVAKAINTGSATSNVAPVGLDLRKAAFARAWKIWGDFGEADAPVSAADVVAQVKDVAVKYGVPAVVGVGGAAHVGTKSGSDTNPAPASNPAPAPSLPAPQAKLDPKAVIAKAQETKAMVEDAKGLATYGIEAVKWARGDGMYPSLIMVAGIAALFGANWWQRRRA